MTSLRKTPVLLIFILSIFCSIPASAKDGFYIGFSGGETQFDGIDRPLLAPVATFGSPALAPFPFDPDTVIFPSSSTATIDEEDTGWKLAIGYQFNQHLSLEASYFDAGEAKISFSAEFPAVTQPAVFIPGNRVSNVNKIGAKGLGLTALASYPITDRFSVLARAGLVYVETKISTRFSSEITAIFFGPTPGLGTPDLLPFVDSFSRTESEVELEIGLGMQYQLSNRFSTRLEWTRYRNAISIGSSEENIDNYSLGIYYHFD